MARVMNRLLAMQNNYLTEGLPVPEEVQLSESDIFELEEYMQHCCPRNPGEPNMILGMKIVVKE